MAAENLWEVAPASASAEWLAYRDQLIAYARAGAESLPPGDVRAQVPESLRPGKHKVHHSYIWLGGLGAAATIIVIAAVSMFSSLIGSLSDIASAVFVVPIVLAGGILMMLAVFALVFLVQWLSWKHLSYELLPEEFNLYSGILNKQRRHVPYQRVQSVNQQAGVLQRVLGVCDVKIDTAGGASNDAIMLKFVRTSEAEALRSEIFRRKKILLAGGAIDEFGNAFVSGAVVPSAWMIANAGGDERAVRIAFGESPEAVQARVAVDATGTYAASATGGQPLGNVLDGADEVLQDIRGVFGGEEVATGSVSYETGLSNKELLFAGLSGAAGHFGVIIAGIIGVASFAAQVFESSIQSWTEDAVEGMVAGTALEGASSSDAASVLGGVFSAVAWEVALWAVLCVLALWAFSVVGSVVQYGGFRVRRRENRIEVEHGLLQRAFHGVDVDRVQTVIIKQSFVRRLIGYCELSVGKIDSLNTDDSNAQSSVRGLVIHPFVKVSRVPEILAGVVPEFSDVPEETVRPASVALRRAIVRRGVIRSASFWLFVVAVAAYAGFMCVTFSGLAVVDPALFSVVQIAFFVYCGFFVLVFVLNVVDAVLWYRRSALGYNRTFMSMTNGGLSVKTSIVPRRKIQYGFVKTNPFQRMAHVAIVNARTAAGVGGTTETLWDVSEEDAAAWIEWVRPRASASVTER